MDEIGMGIMITGLALLTCCICCCGVRYMNKFARDSSVEPV